jgi:hypothetical protein
VPRHLTFRVTRQLRPIIRSQLLKVGSYSVMPFDESSISRALGLRDGIDELELWRLERVAPNLLLHQFQLTLRSHADLVRQIPTNYAAFARFGPTGTIFDFNQDGMARRFLGARTLVLEPHGTILPNLLQIEERHSLSRTYELYPSIRPIGADRFVPLGPEPPGIHLTMPYAEASYRIARCSGVLIVGYSFSQMDDLRTFEWLVDTLRGCGRSILIIDPRPWPILGQLAERLRDDQQQALPVAWDLFAQALLDAELYESTRYKSMMPSSARMIRYLAQQNGAFDIV